MKSPVLILLLIVNLLACPVRCLACETTAAVGTESALAVCSCCSHADETPVSEMPEPCGDHCNCRNCICEGAINDARVELSDVQILVSWALPTHLVAAAVASDADSYAQLEFAPKGHFLHGRDRCIAHQSWLI